MLESEMVDVSYNLQERRKLIHLWVYIVKILLRVVM